MVDDLPAPLTPPECDLRDFAFMPLEVSRLRRSKAWLAAKRDPELGFYMLNLWSASWHDVPCGSVEDDDDVLCDLAMCDPKRWAKVRENVMRGWIKCSDGRLYHPVVCEKALTSYAKKLEQRQRTAAAREARRQRRSQTQSDCPTISVTDTVTEDVTDAVTTSVAALSLHPRDRDRDRESKKEKEAAAGASERSPFLELEGVVPCRENGRPLVNGFYLDATGDAVIDAARLDPARWRGDLRPLVRWLVDGFEPETIIAAVARVAGRSSYQLPFSLAFFDQAVREHRRAA